MEGFFVHVLLFFLFFLFGEAEDLVFRRFFNKLNLWVVAIENILFVESLTVEDAVDVLQHFF